MDIVVNYWILNKIYVLISIVVFVIFAVIVSRLHSTFILDLASNGSCDDPFALYFNKETRTKCISLKQRNDLKPHDDEFKNDATIINNNIDTLRLKMEQTDADYKALQQRMSEMNAQKLLDMKQAIMDLSGNIVNIKTQYLENKQALENLIDDYDSAIQTNTDLLVRVGNNLVNKLTQNIYTPNWNKQRAYLVDAYEKILKYFLKQSENKQSENKQSENKQISLIMPLSPDAIKGKKL